MKKIIAIVLVSIFIFGCSSKTTELEKSPCACNDMKRVS